MLIACRYCGRVHERNFDCGKRPARKHKAKQTAGADETSFRRSEAWTRKSLRIRTRDHFLCQVCIRGLYQYGERRSLNYTDLSVHHAVPIREAWERRLDENNLITLCSLHHEMAESGEIPLQEIQSIIREQQNPAADGLDGTPGG